jgi:BirA family transcriptional regulator, biotin operon repressor / biotin---[acetyl-CoA-carboxylase] ligase
MVAPMHLRLDCIDSTNAFVLAEADDLPDLCLVSAREQTAGRGRQGRTWIAAPGDCLTFTLLVKTPGIDPELLPTAVWPVAVSLARTLESRGLKPGIKWPNDLLGSRGKLGGILIEGILRRGAIAGLAVGIGLNVRAAPVIPGRAVTCVQDELGGREVEMEGLLDELVADLRSAFVNWRVSPRARQLLRQEWLDRIGLIGREVELIDQGQLLSRGEVTGFDELGGLILRTPQGLETFRCGEVSLRL